MANLRKPMFQIRRIIELKIQGKSQHMIAKVLGISCNTVHSYLSSLESHFPDLSTLQTWSDEALDRFINLPKILPATADKAHAQLYKLFEGYEKELAKPGVSRYTLWMEYRQSSPEGIRYSQFCSLFASGEPVSRR
jgi:predicted transcriptional regulator